MGNTVIWKPASSAMLSGYYTLKLLEAAGLPPGVINFIPGDPREISNQLLDSPELAGVHFTGSTEVFNGMWKKIGENVGRYRGYPRLVGETGGKDFIVVHPSADPTEVAVAIARGWIRVPGAEVFGGEPRLRPAVALEQVRERTVAMMKEIKVGDVADFRNFMGAVIDEKAFTKISGYLDDAKTECEGPVWRNARRATDGYFIEPTLIETDGPGIPLPVRGDLRTGRDRVCLSGQRVGARRSTSSIAPRPTR